MKPMFRVPKKPIFFGPFCCMARSSCNALRLIRLVPGMHTASSVKAAKGHESSQVLHMSSLPANNQCLEEVLVALGPGFHDLAHLFHL